jgi:hypothetical protein
MIDPRFVQLAELRAARKRSAMVTYAEIFNTFTIAEAISYWQYMIANHTTTERELTFFAKMLANCQDALYNVLR